MFSSFFSTILLINFQVRSHLWSHSINTPTRTHFARTMPRGFAPLLHLDYRTHVFDRTFARTQFNTLAIWSLCLKILIFVRIFLDNIVFQVQKIKNWWWMEQRFGSDQVRQYHNTACIILGHVTCFFKLSVWLKHV